MTLVRIWDDVKYYTAGVAGEEELQFESEEIPALGDFIMLHGYERLIVKRIYKPPVLGDTGLLVDLLVNCKDKGA